MEDQATRLRKIMEGKAGLSTQRPFRSSAHASQASSAAPSTEEAASGARIIAITSGKGGVGKTNLTVNLAIALGAMGKRVIIIDADLGMANVDVLLGTSSKHNLLHLLQNDVSLNDVIMQGPYGVNYISGGSGIEHAGDYTPIQRAMLFRKLSQCGEMADYILVDTGAGIGKSVLDFILSADDVLLVTTPEPTALTDAYAVMKAYSIYAAEKSLKIIVNRVYDEKESSEVATKLRRTSEKFLHMPVDFLGYIFEDRSLMSSVRRQVPVLAGEPDSLASQCIKAIASGIVYGRHVRVKRGWKGFLRHFLEFS